jgi:L-lactate dehydrogenase (cytochrome)
MAMSRRLSQVFCLDDFEPLARRHLPKPLFGYVSGATETNATLHENRRSFSDWTWLPRALVNVAGRSTACKLFGTTYAAPFGIAPMAIAALTAYRGDLALAQAAQAASVPMVMSSSSLIPMEDVAAAAPDTWFQVYLPRDEGAAVSLVARVKQAGFRVLVITVDSAVVPNRENNLRNRFRTPVRPDWRFLWDGVTHPRWATSTFLRTLAQHGMPHFENGGAVRGLPLVARNADRDFSGREHLDWSIVDTLRKLWDGPLVLKGILHPLDARQARERGADGVIVSNHGGRQLDGAVSPLHVIERIADACSGRIVVMADSGFRRGTDVLKALSLGAQCVFIGRPFNYAAAVAGADGVAHAIALMKNEIRADLGLLGVNSLAELGPHMLERRR